MIRNDVTRVSRGRGYFPGRYQQAHRYQKLTDASICSNDPKNENENTLQESADGISDPIDQKPACSVEPPTDMKSPNIMQSKQGKYLVTCSLSKQCSREVVGKRHARDGSARKFTPSVR